MCKVFRNATFRKIFEDVNISLKDLLLADIAQSTFADKIRYLRTKRGLTQLEFAKLLNKGFGTIVKWELETCKPNLKTITEISSILDIDYNYLLDQD